MQDIYIINSIEHFSYIAIFIFTLLAGYIIPFPEEVVLIIVGYMVKSHFVRFIPAVIFVFVAIIIVDNFLYRLTLRNNTYITKFIHDILSIKFIINHKTFLEKNIGFTIFFSRFLPLLKFIGPVFSGYVKADKKKFFVFNSLGAIIYIPFMIWVGFFFSDNFNQIIFQIGRIKHVTVIFAWIIIGLVISKFVDHFYNKINNN